MIKKFKNKFKDSDTSVVKHAYCKDCPNNEDTLVDENWCNKYDAPCKASRTYCVMTQWYEEMCIMASKLNREFKQHENSSK